MTHTRHSCGPRRQRGLTLILMVTILTLGTAYILVRQMNALSQRLGQDRTTADAMAQAKQALISKAAQNASQPGALLCPDTNNDGSAEASCANTNQRVGRLPWKSLGLPDLRDAAGERLWYALSDNFRQTTAHILNSNTAGTLTLYDGVSGAVTASTVVALVIAPGMELSGQNRSVAAVGTRDPLGATVNDPARANVANYLEGRNNTAQDAGGNNDDAFVQPAATAARPLGQCPILGVAADCNDRMLAITHNDLFSIVENMVGSRLQSTVATYINSYYNIWNAFPFPGTFTDPAAYTGVGTAGVTTGLLPVTNSKSNFTWVTSGGGAPTISCSLGGADCNGAAIACFFGGSKTLELSGSISPNPRCTGSTSTQLSCDIRYRYNCFTLAQATVTVTARVANLGNTFATFPDPGTGSMGRLKWSHFVDNNNYFTNTGQAVGTHVMTLPAAPPYLNSDGTQTITYSFPLAYQSSFSTRTMTLNSVGSMGYLDEPFVSALTSINYGNDWFVRNEWDQLLLYSIAPGSGATGYRPGQTGACAAPNCLTVTNLASPNDNKGVVLVLAGRAIGAQLRSTSAQRSVLSNYFEAPNATAGTTTFTQNRRSTTFNDRVVVVK